MNSERAPESTGRRRPALGAPFVAVTLAVALAVATFSPAVAAADVAPAATRTEDQELVSDPRQDGAQFGHSVAIDGDELIVGMPHYDFFINSLGVVENFSRDGSTWTREAPVIAPDPEANDSFGRAVALDGDTLVVGADGENGWDGAVYVYERPGSQWVFEQKLVAPAPRPAGALFGSSVDVHDDRIVVGARIQGTAYVFARRGSTWEFEQELDPNTSGLGRIGETVAIDGDRAIVGSIDYPAGADAVFVFARNGDAWSEEARFAHGGGADRIVTADLSGDTAIIGTSYSDEAHVYVRTGDSWGFQQTLTATDGMPVSAFGVAVAIEGDAAVVGAREASFVFARKGETWSQRDRLLASSRGGGDIIGYAAALSGDTALTGSPFNSALKGAAYVYDGVLGPYDPIELAGPTRYETAVAASQEAFPNGADTVVIATGENWPDALGGAALAGAYDGPILLTLPSAMPAAVVSEIDRLGAEDAFILGGADVVSQAIEDQLSVKLGATNVTRLGGPTRYETAELIARAVESKVGANHDGTAFVATGLNFPDALAGSPLAAAGPWPIFLAPEAGMTPSTLATMNDIGVTDVLILGGTGVVSQAIEGGLDAGVAGDVTRLAGPTRYETAVEVARYGVGNAHLRWNGVAIATGENFPDALAGGPLQGKKGSVMLLTHTAALTASTGQVLEDEKRDIATVRFLGGPGAVSQAVRDSVAAIAQ